MKSVYTNWCQGTTSALCQRRLCGKLGNGMCYNLYIQFLYYYRSRSLVSGVQCYVEKLPHAVVRWTLSRGKCIEYLGSLKRSLLHGRLSYFHIKSYSSHLLILVQKSNHINKQKI